MHIVSSICLQCVSTKVSLSFCWQKCQTKVFQKRLCRSLRITSLKPSETIIIQLPELQCETFVRGRFNLRRSNIEHIAMSSGRSVKCEYRRYSSVFALYVPIKTTRYKLLENITLHLKPSSAVVIIILQI